MTTQTPPFDWRSHLKVHPAAELFPLLAPDELQALADDIKANGLAQRVSFDKDGRLLDGRNRLDALALSGMLELAPNGNGVGVKGADVGIGWKLLDELDPYDVVISLNAHRRHLTAEQKRDLIAKVLKAKPNASNNSIAKRVKADDKTVASVRRELEGRSEIPNAKERTDSKGRKQPARKPKKSEPAVAAKAADQSAPTDDDAETPVTHAEHFAALKRMHKLEKANYELAAALERVGRGGDGALGNPTAIELFDTHITALLALIKGQRPQHFAKTAVAQTLLGDFAHFIRELVAVRKLVTDDPTTSGEANLDIPGFLRRDAAEAQP
jgi:hypothetical protein